MAARVTKMFLQNCVQSGPAAQASDKPALKGKGSASVGLKKSALSTSKKLTHKSKKKKAVAPQTVRALDAARKEQQQADQTKANVKKLTIRTTTKSQRLMAQVLAQRKTALR